MMGQIDVLEVLKKQDGLTTEQLSKKIGVNEGSIRYATKKLAQFGFIDIEKDGIKFKYYLKFKQEERW